MNTAVTTCIKVRTEADNTAKCLGRVENEDDRPAYGWPHLYETVLHREIPEDPTGAAVLISQDLSFPPSSMTPVPSRSARMAVRKN